MDIRYFYVTEQVGRKTIHVTHSPTKEMVGDFFTKPLQGSLFLKMRNYIMGNEEPRYQDLPRNVLRKYDSDDDAIRKQKFTSPTLLQRRWWETSSRNHCKVHYFLRCVTILWVMKSLVIRIFPGMC